MDHERAFEIIESRAALKDPAPNRLTKSIDGFTRQDVVKAFAMAFEMVGGVQRLALWANANPDKFFPLYARFQPTNTIIMGDNAKIEIVHALPPTELDKHGSPQD